MRGSDSRYETRKPWGAVGSAEEAASVMRAAGLGVAITPQVHKCRVTPVCTSN